MYPRRLLLPLLLLLSAVSAAQGHARDRAALLVVEYEAVNGIAEIQHLYRYRFADGELVAKDLILTTKTDDVRFDLGENRIHRDRYVITEWGDVVDVQAKKLLHQGDGEFVAVEGDRVIQHLNKTSVEGYFYYDLGTGRYDRLGQPGKWALPGVLSPDETRSAEGVAGRIWLYELGRRRRLLGDGFLIQASISASFAAGAPVFWLDNDRLLTQTANGRLVILGMNGRMTPVVDIPIKELPAGRPPSLHRNRDGKIVYECAGEAFVVDVAQQSYSAYEWAPLGHEFEGGSESDPAYGHVIRHRGTEIGRGGGGGGGGRPPPPAATSP